MYFFYSDTINKNKIILDPSESKHCIKVLRKSIGDIINVVDGKGSLYKGSIKSIENGICKVEIIEIKKNYQRKDYYIHIAISPLKNNNRIEWFVEKCVELGVDEISFIYCSRTLKKTIRLNRILNTAIVAMKQTLKAKIPKINNLEKLSDFLDSSNASSRYICHLEKSHRDDLFSFKEDIRENKHTCILIGPEGDFTKDEILFSNKSGFKPVTLGDSRLRTETAGVVACHILNIINR
tara:strand:+ start:351 stop:1061 length:711 start_codon:yes stop_codon:yes gene_type:complete